MALRNIRGLTEAPPLRVHEEGAIRVGKSRIKTMHVGFDNDICRSTDYPPMQYRMGLTGTFAFITYDISMSVFLPSGSRY